MDFNASVNLIQSQQNLPWALFLITFGVLTVLEIADAAYAEKTPRLLRWPNHFLLAFLNALILRFILPSFALWVSMTAVGKQFGVMNRVEVPQLAGILLTMFFLDWILYYLHRAYHSVPWLWKIHRVHHTDPEVDVTTGLRFHPIELIVTTLVKALFIFLIGAPMYGVFLFEIEIALFTLYDHSNIDLPRPAERIIRWLTVTPYMHRVHHSQELSERNSNFGFMFSVWDRLLGTYKNPEKVEHLNLGLAVFQTTRYLRLKALLLQPFLDSQGNFKWNNVTKDV